MEDFDEMACLGACGSIHWRCEVTVLDNYNAHEFLRNILRSIWISRRFDTGAELSCNAMSSSVVTRRVLQKCVRENTISSTDLTIANHAYILHLTLRVSVCLSYLALSAVDTVFYALKLHWLDRRIPGTYRTLILRKLPKVSRLYCFIFILITLIAIFSIKSSY